MQGKVFPLKQTAVPASNSAARAQRISVVGASGSGKTVLARELADLRRLPLHELDRLRRDAAGLEVDEAQFIKQVEVLVEGGRWIIDGHYRSVRAMVWARADLVIWLDYPLHVTAGRLLRRFADKKFGRSAVSQSNKARSGTSPGQSVGWAHRVRRILRNLKERQDYGRILNDPATGNFTLVRLGSPGATRRWVSSIAASEESKQRNDRE